MLLDAVKVMLFLLWLFISHVAAGDCYESLMTYNFSE